STCRDWENCLRSRDVLVSARDLDLLTHFEQLCNGLNAIHSEQGLILTNERDCDSGGCSRAGPSHLDFLTHEFVEMHVHERCSELRKVVGLGSVPKVVGRLHAKVSKPCRERIGQLRCLLRLL